MGLILLNLGPHKIVLTGMSRPSFSSSHNGVCWNLVTDVVLAFYKSLDFVVCQKICQAHELKFCEVQHACLARCIKQYLFGIVWTKMSDFVIGSTVSYSTVCTCNADFHCSDLSIPSSLSTDDLSKLIQPWDKCFINGLMENVLVIHLEIFIGTNQISSVSSPLLYQLLDDVQFKGWNIERSLSTIHYNASHSNLSFYAGIMS